MPSKLHFCVTITKVLVPFLELFQTDKPMMPSHSVEIKGIHTFASKIHKEKCFGSSKECVQDESKKENAISAEQICSQTCARNNLKREERNSLQVPVLEFQKECITFLQETMIGKLVKRCLVKYATVIAMNDLDPRFIAANMKKAVEKMEAILQKLLNNKQV